MRTPQKPTVLLLIDPSRAYERALLKGIAQYAQLHGPWIFVREAPFWERPSRAALLRQLQTVDGIIMREGPFLKEILSHHIPAIVSNYATEHIPGVTNLVSDHEAIGRLVAQHLLERGFKHFAFCGYPALFWSRQRFKGFETCLKQAGHPVVHDYQPTNAHVLPGEVERAHLLRWLRELPKPVGLMACIDERSQQVVEACQSEGIAIPEQVAIVGVDNDEMICTLSTIPLSSVAINAEKGGFAAAARLHSLMQNKRTKSLSPICIKPSHVIARTSSDLLLVDDPQVGKALRYIRENCKRFLYVEEVARVAGLSRRVLEKRFRSVLHRSVLEHLRHCRIDLISAMLLESTMTISEISLATGFSDAAHIARYFRSQTGISPQEYRKRNQL